MFEKLDTLRPGAHWLLRLPFATVFLFHGGGKIATFSSFSEMMGLHPVVAALVTVAEITAGIGIIYGGLKSALITRLAGLAAMPVMLGAIVLVHWPRWSFVATDEYPMGGMEFQLVLLSIAAYFMIVGNARAADSGQARILHQMPRKIG